MGKSFPQEVPQITPPFPSFNVKGLAYRDNGILQNIYPTSKQNH